ncbi:hypothetical protein [Duganella sp. HH101]|uniref:hypothetical protein n=1 Tax=Duganella sp. HH101 TaxID=1781066 RepID=UPI00087464CB|nr:hypothetical protein [Duganella sp. HH101]
MALRGAGLAWLPAGGVRLLPFGWGLPLAVIGFLLLPVSGADFGGTRLPVLPSALRLGADVGIPSRPP